MSIALKQNDFERLVGIHGGMPDFRTVQGRMDFVTHVFAGTPRRHDLIASLNVDGTPRAVAVRFVDRLQAFGQDEPGRETLGVLVNKMLSYLGGTEDARYLRELMTRYPFHTRPTADRGAPDDWAGQESPDQVTEKIIGENTLRDIALLEVALEAARAVSRVKTPVSVGWRTGREGGCASAAAWHVLSISSWLLADARRPSLTAWPRRSSVHPTYIGDRLGPSGRDGAVQDRRCSSSTSSPRSRRRAARGYR
ncbi:hypothetical protein ACIHEJ_35285 [Streptomyces sp. NPDC052301]|uniref:hypothetical protein n=1 Tax=Streptomyces sp. NPDC052301 TaxID=3365687 RepID=UPI0037D72ACC